MSATLTAVGLLLAAVGLLGTLAPARLASLVASADPIVLSRVGGIVRVVLGALLLAAAPTTRHPGAVALLGGVTRAAGLVLLILDRPRAGRLLAWWRSLTPLGLRAWCACAAALGAFLVHTAR
jgi:hypothetical protein